MRICSIQIIIITSFIILSNVGIARVDYKPLDCTVKFCYSDHLKLRHLIYQKPYLQSLKYSFLHFLHPVYLWLETTFGTVQKWSLRPLLDSPMGGLNIGILLYIIFQSDCYSLEDTDEGEEYRRLKQSMEMVGFSQVTQARYNTFVWVYGHL